MRICFVGRGALRAFAERYDEATAEKEGADLILFGFNGLGEVSYEKELKGETRYFEDAALLSKRAKTTVACGCITDTRGHKRKSVVIAENGRLTGVSDMLNVVDGEVGCGAALRVYETKAGRMGVAVAEDLHFPEVIKTLAVCGSDFIVCPYGKVDELQSVLLRANAYCYGVPIFFCAEGYGAIADVSGRIAFASPQSPAYTDFKPTKEYHLVETRRRGFYRPKRLETFN
ncbi:MAG: hypothetical protein IJX91_01275 [Clostridia bacterium]|nr:hypothetical protein [Clostridia bacterium]